MAAGVLAGSGEFLAEQVIEEHLGAGTRVISLGRERGAELSAAACAHAVAMLALERCCNGR